MMVYPKEMLEAESRRASLGVEMWDAMVYPKETLEAESMRFVRVVAGNGNEYETDSLHSRQKFDLS